jgi:serine/threonine kinase PknH
LEAAVEGTPFGRYRLLEQLGRGGMGEVWRAHDTEIDRIVALKMLLPRYAKDRTFEQRFRREARAAARLDEPHVVPIHDVGELDGRLYVTMRLINGCDLQTLIEDGPLDARRAVGIIEQIASALNAAHQVRLVHRDVKPSNILITDDDFAYLIDFGIARAAGETGLTSIGTTVGTWEYMAPERFRTSTADAGADIYALTCVLYQSLTGQPPFHGSLEQLALAHMAEPPPKPSALQHGVPPAMDQVIATGMAKDPAQRFATTKRLATAARAATTEPMRRPPIARPPSHPQFPAAQRPPTTPAPPPGPHGGQPPQTPVRPQPATPPPFPHPATPPPSAAPTGKRRRRTLVLAGLAIVAVIALVTVVIVTQGRPHSGGSTSTSAALVTAGELDGLLLNAAAINTAMHTSGMTATGDSTSMADDSSEFADRDCLGMAYPAQDLVYSGTGWQDVRRQEFLNPGGTVTQSVKENVVAFGSADAATAFYDASSQAWSACANRQFEVNDNGKKATWSVGQVSDQNGMLTTSATPISNATWTTQRALTVKNNVVIDIEASCGSPPSQYAADIAEQIAATVPS